MKYLYSVPKNGVCPVCKYEVIKETPKTYVVKGGVSERVLKSTMSNKYCVFFEDEKSAQLFYERVKYNPKKPKRPKKPLTHFDRIKAMSVEEMAEFIFVNFQTDEWFNPIVDNKIMFHENDVAEWLKSEVQENDSE